MMFASEPTFALNEEEASELARIDFDFGSGPDRLETLRRSCAAARLLAESLLRRNAIPEIRLRYFTDPVLNIGVSRSRQGVFEQKGVTGAALLEHGHFLKHLRYFLFGPDLPAETIAGLAALVADDVELDELWSFARKETRRLQLDGRKASEEFFKLALECGLEDYEAQSVRDTVRAIRVR